MNMRKRLIVFLALICLLVLIIHISYANSKEDEKIEVIDTVESFFKNLKDKDFKGVWSLLTRKSKGHIIKDVYKEIRNTGEKISIQEIRTDFDNCGKICRSYWEGYLSTFDPKMVLEESEWRIGKIKKDKAELIIHYKDSERPAKIKLFEEDGKWKLGLVETFWTRKRR